MAVPAPEGAIVPTEEFPPGIPFTCQLTARFAAFCTVAMKSTLAPAAICAEDGEMLTVTGVGVSDVPLERAPAPPPLHETC